MPNVGTPIHMKEILHGTSCFITEVTVTSIASNKFIGKIKIENSSGTSKESHAWTATCAPGEKWEVLGEGAKLLSGNRVKSTKTYPFSTHQLINSGVRKFLSDWLGRNKHLIREQKEAQAFVLKPIPLQPVHPVQPVVSSAKIEIVEVLLSQVRPFEGQPREEFTSVDLTEMTNSIKQEKQKQLIIVTPLVGVPGKLWELVDGERRYRGALDAGLATLMAVVRRYKDKEEQFWDSFTMNLNRRGHTPIETSRAIARAIQAGKTVLEICMATGYSNCTVYQYMQLQRLDQKLQDLMRMSTQKVDRIGFSVGNKLSRLPNKEDQVRIWEIARQEKTPGLRSLKVDILAAPILALLPVRGRIRKPGDNAIRLLRILQSAETGLAFAGRATPADLEAFVSYEGKTTNGGNVIARVIAVAAKWEALKQKVVKVV
jgi:ParB/RepB/Spo0J family partition protein